MQYFLIVLVSKNESESKRNRVARIKSMQKLYIKLSLYSKNNDANMTGVYILHKHDIYKSKNNILMSGAQNAPFVTHVWDCFEYKRSSLLHKRHAGKI